MDNIDAVASMIAVRQGLYVALLLGLMAGICVATASLWFLALGPAAFLRSGRPFMQLLGTRRLRRLRVWCLMDGVLVLVLPLLLVILA